MSTHLKYQKLPWGGYVVRNEHVFKRVISERFEGCPLRPIAIPPSYPCVIWFRGYDMFWSKLPLTTDAGLRALGELAEMNKYHERDLVREPTPEQIEATGDIAADILSICKLQRWAGVNMRKLCEKFFFEERKHRGMMYLEIRVDALDWDRRPPGVDENGIVKEWFHNLYDVRPSHKGLTMYFNQGIAQHIHGSRPVITWESIVNIGSLRPGGKTHLFSPARQYEQTPLLNVFQDIAQMAAAFEVLEHIQTMNVDFELRIPS